MYFLIDRIEIEIALLNRQEYDWTKTRNWRKMVTNITYEVYLIYGQSELGCKRLYN